MAVQAVMLQLAQALVLPVDDALWTVRTRFDAAACVLADRHYSRRPGKVGSNQVGGVGRTLTLVSPCERNLWVTRYLEPAHATTYDSLDAFRCSYFHREAGTLASEQIEDAMRITHELWGDPPGDGWVTWIDTRKVASHNPGYCFKQAGWWLDREWTHRYLVRLRA